MLQITYLKLLAFLLTISLFAGCERSTLVRVEGGTIPVFAFTGSGNLSSFSVYVVSPSDLKLGRIVDSLSSDSFFTEPAQWSVEAPDSLYGSPVEGLSNLTYGVVPPGYKQRIPADGSAPASMIPGRTYFYECSTTNAPGVRGAFQVLNGKSVPVQVDLPCLQARNGKEVTIPCSKTR